MALPSSQNSGHSASLSELQYGLPEDGPATTSVCLLRDIRMDKAMSYSVLSYGQQNYPGQGFSVETTERVFCGIKLLTL